MVVLRAGESMDLDDMLPSRMERARLKVADFATARKGQPMGLIAYAGSAHLVLPPTRDTSIVASMAAEISPEIMPKLGDDLAAALQLADRTLGDTRGTVVVVADDAEEARRRFSKQIGWTSHGVEENSIGLPKEKKTAPSNRNQKRLVRPLLNHIRKRLVQALLNRSRVLLIRLDSAFFSFID